MNFNYDYKKAKGIRTDLIAAIQAYLDTVYGLPPSDSEYLTTKILHIIAQEERNLWKLANE